MANGEETFKHILEALEGAVHHIHLEYYTVRDDEIGNKIKSILIQKAREGVKVRFLYDAVGSWKLSNHYINDLKRAGIDVRLLVPKNPDKRIVFHASCSYFPDLLEAGVKIYEYEKGFMHSKIVIVDHELASIGTSNMDMRSFHLNFEVNVFLYRTESTKKLVSEYVNDLRSSKKINYEVFQKRHLGYRLLESTSRLLSPLL